MLTQIAQVRMCNTVRDNSRPWFGTTNS